MERGLGIRKFWEMSRVFLFGSYLEAILTYWIALSCMGFHTADEGCKGR